MCVQLNLAQQLQKKTDVKRPLRARGERTSAFNAARREVRDRERGEREGAGGGRKSGVARSSSSISHGHMPRNRVRRQRARQTPITIATRPPPRPPPPPPPPSPAAVSPPRFSPQEQVPSNGTQASSYGSSPQRQWNQERVGTYSRVTIVQLEVNYPQSIKAPGL